MEATTDNNKVPFVVIRLKEQLYGIASSGVRELIRLGRVSRIPKAPEYVRGLMNLRGQVVPLIDMRLRLGLPSSGQEQEELQTLIAQRKQDHINWITELLKSVDEEREFKLATDPHQCAFGKWYDQFKTDNIVLRSTLKEFEEPHAHIHGIAHQVEELKGKGKLEEARKLIELTRDTDLRRMVDLFDSFQKQLKKANREIAVVMHDGRRTFAVSADSVESVECFTSGFEPLPVSLGEGQNMLFPKIARREKDSRFVWILDVVKLLEGMTQGSMVAAEA